jgi:hypothetical protein
LRAAGPANLAGKPVIDATNPIADKPPVITLLLRCAWSSNRMPKYRPKPWRAFASTTVTL